VIRLFGVDKSYPGRGPVLKGLDLHVARGEFAILRGPSGAGKTTLLRLVTAAERPDSGQVMVAGRNLAKLRRSAIPYLRRNIGVIFQDFRLLGGETVLENVALPLRICGVHGRVMRARVDEVLTLVGLQDKALARCRSLSGGEQQRVALARALAANPVLLIADEPTGNLDPVATQEVLEHIADVARRGVTVLLATHDPQVLRGSSADRVLELGSGKILRDAVRSAVPLDAQVTDSGRVEAMSLLV